MIGHRSHGSGILQAQLSALGMLGGDVLGVLEDGGHEGVDLVLRDIVAGENDSADSNGVGVSCFDGGGGTCGGSGLFLGAATNQAGHHGDSHQDGKKLLHLLFLFS